MPSGRKQPDKERLERIVAEARRAREEREKGYRARALKRFPWFCARCGREFTRATLHQLTVHHRDGNHDNNPPDGSNWELLCIYCHENEHARVVDESVRGRPVSGAEPESRATYKPFADLEALLRGRK